MSASFRLVCLGGAALTVCPATEGSRFVGIGPARQALAGGGLADPQDGTWQMANPASLCGQPREVGLHLEVLMAQVGVSPSGALATPGAGTLEDEPVVATGSAHWVQPWGPGTLGLALAPYAGLSIDLPGGRSVFGEPGGYDRHLAYAATRFGASYAVPLGQGFTLGATLCINHASLQSDSMTRGLVETEGNDQRDQALGAGVKIGFQYRLPGFGAALAYTSRQWFAEFSDYDDLLAGPLDDPQTLELGLSLDLCPRCTVNTDFRWIAWSGIEALGDPDTGFGWDDQLIAGVSLTTRLAEDRWLARAGFSYGRSPIGEDVAFLNGLSPLIAEWHLGLGLGWRPGPSQRWDLTVQHALHNDLEDDGSRLGGAGAGTKLELSVTSLALGWGWRY